MAISSINFQKAKAHCFFHNDRTHEPKYLVDDKSLNEFDRSAKEARKEFDAVFNERLKEAKGNRKPDKKNSMWEAVVNLNAGHTLKDIERLSEHIEAKFGFKAIQMAVHRDEGKDRQNKNYHAHIVFCTIGVDGKQKYRAEFINPKTLKELQGETAQILGMERGVKDSKTQRLEHREYKEFQRQKEVARATLGNEIKAANELYTQKKELEYNFRETQKRITALEVENTDLKKELHRLNTEVNKTKELEKIAELQAKIAQIEQNGKKEGKDTIEFENLKKEALQAKIKNHINEAQDYGARTNTANKRATNSASVRSHYEHAKKSFAYTNRLTRDISVTKRESVHERFNKSRAIQSYRDRKKGRANTAYNASNPDLRRAQRENERQREHDDAGRELSKNAYGRDGNFGRNKRRATANKIRTGRVAKSKIEELSTQLEYQGGIVHQLTRELEKANRQNLKLSEIVDAFKSKEAEKTKTVKREPEREPDRSGGFGFQID